MGNVQGVYGEGFDQIKARAMNKGKKTIVFASNNQHKLEEIRAILGDKFEIRSLEDIGCNSDIPETSGTLEGNALQKAEFVKKFYGYDCFADDTGLECDALGGEPGVLSARYAGGDGHDSEANMQKLLGNLKGKDNRSAQFRTVIALIYNDKTYYFDGTVRGRIIDEKKGNGGFGYDPIFVPDGYDKTFAELGSDVKNTISHRALAVDKLAKFLNA
jgi:XTP/dITP diphosphohydrolase